MQNTNLQTLTTILGSVKATEIPGILRSLSADDQDTLMKYLYKCMAMPGWGDVSGSVLLGWHEKVRSVLSVLFFWLFLLCFWVARPFRVHGCGIPSMVGRADGRVANMAHVHDAAHGLDVMT